MSNMSSLIQLTYLSKWALACGLLPVLSHVGRFGLDSRFPSGMLLLLAKSHFNVRSYFVVPATSYDQRLGGTFTRLLQRADPE